MAPFDRGDPGRPRFDDTTLFLGATSESFQTFLGDPPVWELAHLAVIAWVLDTTAGELLLVRHRLHGWSCPGGHVDVGESPQQAVERELFEETGLVVVAESTPLTVARSVGCARHASATHWTVGYVFAAESSAALSSEPGQPARFFSLDELPDQRAADIDLVVDRLRSPRSENPR